MNDNALQQPVIQDHSAFLAGNHDFQADIQILADSDLVGTILETVMLATNMRFAAVARVTADRWVACHTVDEVNFGLAEGDEIEIQSTFCQSVRETSNKVLFNDTATDDVYGNHPIAAKFGIVSYASIPITAAMAAFSAPSARSTRNLAISSTRARWRCLRCSPTSSAAALRLRSSWRQRSGWRSRSANWPEFRRSSWRFWATTFAIRWRRWMQAFANWTGNL